MKRLLCALLLSVAPCLPSSGQEVDLAQGGSIVADRVTLERSGRLTASGGVEIVTADARVTADALSYDRESGVLNLQGPIRVETADGAVLLADGGRLDGTLEEGIVTGVRLVIERQLQIAAAELARNGPRYDSLVKAVASSCEVCEARPVPLWEIRAREIVHDREERQIYFSGAQFRIAGVPVAYLPYLRLPGPGNERSTGFLPPRFVSSSKLGFGVGLPYFVVLGPSRDVTITPTITAESASLGVRYRQAFTFGTLSTEGSVARDGVTGEGLRGHLFSEGRFVLPGGERLEFDVQQASDDTYLLDYGISGANLLRNEVRLIDVSSAGYSEARVTYWDRLRDPARSSTAPDRQAGATFERRRALGGGILTWGGDALGYVRTSSSDVDGEDADTIPDGRDGAIAAAHAEWQRREVLGPGLDVAILFRLDAQQFAVGDDSAFPETISRIAPSAAAELRWPFLRRSGAVSDVIEPILSLQWSGNAEQVPIEEGTRPELDFGNLFALQRIGGPEGIEEGARIAGGLAWTREAPGGTLSLALGRIVRAESSKLFPGDGLGGRATDWLTAAQVRLGNSHFDGRAMFDSNGVSRGEANVTIDRARWDLNAGYTFQKAAIELDGTDRPRTSEMALGAGYAVTRNWETGLEVAYDFEQDRAQRATLAVDWLGQCARARADITRRYSSSADLSPETRFGLSVSLTGIAGEDSRPGACGP